MLILIIALLTSLFGYMKVKAFIAINKCVDRGGIWYSEQKRCDSAESNYSSNILKTRHKISEIKKSLDSNENIDSIQLLYDFEFFLTPEIENWYKDNYEKRINSKSFLLTTLYSMPTSESKAIGKMVAYYDTLISNFRIQLVDNKGKTVKEFNEIGDWGYGIHLNVIAQSESFIKLPMEYFHSNAWINKKSVNGSSSTFKEMLISVSSVTIINIQTGEELKNVSGSFLVMGFENGNFVLRKEIPEDMPCGADFETTENIDSLPKFYLKIQELKTKNGDFNIWLTYPRGC